MNIKDTTLEHNMIAIRWLGQSGYQIKNSNQTIVVIDPYLSDSIICKMGEGYRRISHPPIDPSELEADIVIITHDHLDHFDEETITPLKSNKKTKFVCPRSVKRHLLEMGFEEKRVLKIDTGEKNITNGITLEAVFALPTHEDVLDSIGLVITFPDDIKVYITGDTAECFLLNYIKNYYPDIMISCINGDQYNLSTHQAVRLALEINPPVIIPCHYGLFAMQNLDPNEFVKELQQANYLGQGLILTIDELCTIRKVKYGDYRIKKYNL